MEELIKKYSNIKKTTKSVVNKSDCLVDVFGIDLETLIEIKSTVSEVTLDFDKRLFSPDNVMSTLDYVVTSLGFKPKSYVDVKDRLYVICTCK